MKNLKSILAITLLISIFSFTESYAQLYVTNLTGCDLGGRATWQVPFSCVNSGGAPFTVPASTGITIPIPFGLTTHFVVIYQGTPWALTYVSDGCAYPNVDDIMPAVGCVATTTHVAMFGNNVRIYQ